MKSISSYFVKTVDILAIFIYDYSIDMIEARKTRVRFLVSLAEGGDGKGIPPRQDERCQALSAGPWEKILRTVALVQGGALL